jgi:hypothetical protein
LAVQMITHEIHQLVCERPQTNEKYN